MPLSKNLDRVLLGYANPRAPICMARRAVEFSDLGREVRGCMTSSRGHLTPRGPAQRPSRGRSSNLYRIDALSRAALPGLSFAQAGEAAVSVLERTKFSLDVVRSLEKGISTRRFHWRLTATNQPALMSSDNYATKREAMHDGEIALERARQRGRLHVHGDW